MKHAAEICDEQNVVLDGDGTTAAVHRRLELFRIRTYVVPHGSRIGIVALQVTIFGHHRLQPLVWDRLGGIFGIVNQGRADITAFGGIDAP